MRAVVEKLEQKVTVILLEGGAGRWCYEIECVAYGRFRWLRGYGATRMRYEPSNFWWAPPIQKMEVEPARGGGYAVMAYFKPNAIKPGQRFRLHFAFDLNPTWNADELKFSERLLNDAKVTQMRFLLPPGYELEKSNRPPDRVVDAGSPLLIWDMTAPNTVYQFEFTIRRAGLIP